MTFKSCFIPQFNRHCKFQVPEMQILHHIGPYLDMRLHLPYTAQTLHMVGTSSLPEISPEWSNLLFKKKILPCCIQYHNCTWGCGWVDKWMFNHSCTSSTDNTNHTPSTISIPCITWSSTNYWLSWSANYSVVIVLSFCLLAWVSHFIIAGIIRSNTIVIRIP